LTDKFESLTAQISDLSVGLRNFREVQERQAGPASTGRRARGTPFGACPGMPSPFGRGRSSHRSSSESSASENEETFGLVNSGRQTRGVGLQTDTNTSGVPATAGATGGPPNKNQRLSALHSASNCERLFSTLRTNLFALQEEGKLKSRDAHELKVLSGISEATTLDAVHKLVNDRLAELYIAATRSWNEVRNYQRRDVDELLDLPPLQQQIVVKQTSSTRQYGGGNKQHKKKSGVKKSKAT
jgi:hypothetical protein